MEEFEIVDLEDELDRQAERERANTDARRREAEEPSTPPEQPIVTNKAQTTNTKGASGGAKSEGTRHNNL